jgi:ATP-dependent exoDNAse (exonuclease V) beta subunit
VHRLFERDADTQLPDHALSALTLTLVRREEAVDVPDLPGFIDEAVRVYRALRSQGDVSAWLEHATPHYEVPFSYVDPARPDEIVRGTLDCVLVGPDGVPVVLEFKTGARRAEHQAQAAIYEQAARAVFGVETARVRLVYLESGPDL